MIYLIILIPFLILLTGLTIMFFLEKIEADDNDCEF